MMERIDFRAEGMTCEHCALTIEQLLRKTQGVHSAHVSFSSKSGQVNLSGQTSFEELRRNVKEVGYDLLPIAKDSLAETSPSVAQSLRHIVIIGGGSGAFAAAIRASDLGARVTIVERGMIGSAQCSQVMPSARKSILSIIQSSRKNDLSHPVGK